MVHRRGSEIWPAYRVRAPALRASAAMHWALTRAYGASTAAVPPQFDAAEAVRYCTALELGPRIAARHAAILTREIGAGAARDLTFQRLQVVAVDRILGTVADEVVEAARHAGVPLVLLKHVALRRGGYVAEGERPARDVDVLVSPARAEELQQALKARGFRSGTRAPTMHLPPLRRGPAEVVEIHHTMWGVRLPERDHKAGDANADDLIASGLTRPLADGTHLPDARVLATHAIVHGLIQHRTSPEGYPAMRALSDLVSLGLAGEQVELRCCAFLRHRSEQPLVRTALRLAARLQRPDGLATLEPQAADHELLGHIFAASTDEGYRRALRFERLGELGNLAAIRSAWSFALGERTGAVESNPEPSEASATRFGSLLRRFERPRELARELLRGASSYAELQLRRR